jgi:uncharacterized Tic20 family protein
MIDDDDSEIVDINADSLLNKLDTLIYLILSIFLILVGWSIFEIIRILRG